LREFLEGKARNLGNDVINARLETRGGFAGDVVPEFVEQVADGEFGGDFSVTTKSVCNNYFQALNKRFLMRLMIQAASNRIHRHPRGFEKMGWNFFCLPATRQG
jgi:hypothetical protein